MMIKFEKEHVFFFEISSREIKNRYGDDVMSLFFTIIIHTKPVATSSSKYSINIRRLLNIPIIKPTYLTEFLKTFEWG